MGVTRAITLPSVPLTNTCIRLFRNENGTGAEMHPAIVSGIVTEDTLVSYWPIFFVVPSNSPRSLRKSQLDPVSLSFLKWQMMVLGRLSKDVF